jgi:hypothetical protein
MRLITLLVILALPAAQALDFTPREVKEVGEGGEYTYVRFSDTGKGVTYRPPKHWDYRGGGSVFRLDPPNVLGAEVEIVRVQLDAPLVASEETIKTFEALALDSLPPRASKVETPVATFNPCELDGRKTVEVTISYVLFGQPLMVSRLYLPRQEDMLCFTVVSKPGDFEQVRRVFQASLHTLAGLY